MGFKLTPSQERTLLKCSKNGAVSAKDFREIILQTSSCKNKKTKPAFLFKLDAAKSTEGYIFTLYGKHASTNTINGWLSLGRRMAYNNAIKDAAATYFLSHQWRQIKPTSPLSSVVIQPIAYNPKSRDDDGCARTLKVLRDVLTINRVIVDDNRKCAIQLQTDEILSKEYKIELIVTPQK